MPLAKTGSLWPRKRLLRNVAMATVTIIVALSVGATVVGVLAERPHAHLRLVGGWVCLAIVGFLVTEIAHAELWRRLIAALGRRLDPLSGLAIWCVSALARYVPTSMLMPVVRVSMSRARQVPASVCMASLVYEAVFAICGALWVASYFVIALPALHGAVWRWGVLLLPLMFMLALHPSGVKLVSHRLLRRLGQDPLPIHLPVRRLAAFTAGYAASFLLAGCSLVVLVLAFQPLPARNIPLVIGAFAIAFAASALSFILPGGLGVREAVLVGALSLVMPVFAATTIAIAARLIQLALELLLALLAPWLAMRQRSHQSQPLPKRKRSPHDPGGSQADLQPSKSGPTY
jgi:uncharacterized membrane protein YbhN (UPF0104 family)